MTDDALNPLDVRCPDCRAKKGVWCVYIQPKAPVGTGAWIVQNERAGKPTKRLHNGRFFLARQMNRAAEYAAREAEYAAKNAASPDRAAILRANAEAVADEQRQLVAWLRQHGSIFEGER